MEIIQYKSQFVDENNTVRHLIYSVFTEQADGEFPAGSSISVEMTGLNGTETAVAHRISDPDYACALARLMCKNTVTPATFHDIVQDYISGAVLC